MTLRKRGFKLGLIAPVLAIGFLAPAPASAAGPGGLSSIGALENTGASHVIQVQRRGNRRRRAANRANRRAAINQHASNRRRARRKRRQKVLLGIGLGILGAAVLANRHYDRPRTYNRSSYAYGGGDGGYRAAKRRCARHFEDYEWRTDLVYDRYGDERLCPYVRKYY